MLIAVLRSALMDYTRLGKRIKEERLRLNLTQEKLSEKSGYLYRLFRSD